MMLMLTEFNNQNRSKQKRVARLISKLALLLSNKSTCNNDFPFTI